PQSVPESGGRDGIGAVAGSRLLAEADRVDLRAFFVGERGLRGSPLFACELPERNRFRMGCVTPDSRGIRRPYGECAKGRRTILPRESDRDRDPASGRGFVGYQPSSGVGRDGEPRANEAGGLPGGGSRFGRL